MSEHMTIRVPKRGLKIVLVMAIIVAVLAPVAVIAAGGTFTDDDTSVFEADIEWMAATGITFGCNPPANDNYCPTKAVNRGQMAAFMHRLAVNKVVDAATAVTADSATNADHATTADSATLAEDAKEVDGKSAIEFQPTTNDFESADDFTVSAAGTYTIASGTVSTNDGSGWLCLIGSVPRADIRVSASATILGMTGASATFYLADESGQISGTVRRASASNQSFAMEWLYETVGGTDTFELVANEGGGDTYTVADAVIMVEVISETRCKGNPIIVLPGEPASENPDINF